MASAFYQKSVVLPLVQARLSVYEKSIAKFIADHPEPPPETPEQREARIEEYRNYYFHFRTPTREEAEQKMKQQDIIAYISRCTCLNDMALENTQKRMAGFRKTLTLIQTSVGDTILLSDAEAGELFAAASP